MTELLSPRLISFALLLTAIAINLSAETILKKGLNQTGEMSFTPQSIFQTLTTPAVFIGFCLAFVAALFWTKVLSRESLSWAYPMLALGYIPLLYLSSEFLNEEISLQRISGVLVVVVGVIMVFRS